MRRRRIPFHLQIALFGVAAGMLVMAGQNLPRLIDQPQDESYQVANIKTVPQRSCSLPSYGNEDIASIALKFVSDTIFCTVR